MDEMHADCSSAEPFALQVTDDSMEPEFPNGCIIIVEPMRSCESHAFVVAEYDDVRWFRRYVEYEGSRYLAALNERYPLIELTRSFSILGLVVQRNVKRKIKHYPLGLLP
jgi:SOS-response transcriptional repressor LexA